VSQHPSKDHKRSKSGKQQAVAAAAAAVSRGAASHGSDRETSPPPPLPVEKTTVSKYQSKKAKKQVRVTRD
jgi:hypothetical protein